MSAGEIINALAHSNEILAGADELTQVVALGYLGANLAVVEGYMQIRDGLETLAMARQKFTDLKGPAATAAEKVDEAHLIVKPLGLEDSDTELGREILPRFELAVKNAANLVERLDAAISTTQIHSEYFGRGKDALKEDRRGLERARVAINQDATAVPDLREITQMYIDGITGSQG